MVKNPKKVVLAKQLLAHLEFFEIVTRSQRDPNRLNTITVLYKLGNHRRRKKEKKKYK